jgi:hypothetical protein
VARVLGRARPVGLRDALGSLAEAAKLILREILPVARNRNEPPLFLKRLEG